jgi:hypothetical protein
MNYLNLLTELFQSLLALGQAIAADGSTAVAGLEQLWTDLQSAYNDIVTAISNFTSPTPAQVEAAQDVLSRVNTALQPSAEKQG